MQGRRGDVPATRRAGAGGPAWLAAIVLCASVGWTRDAPAYEVPPERYPADRYQDEYRR